MKKTNGEVERETPQSKAVSPIISEVGPHRQKRQTNMTRDIAVPRNRARVSLSKFSNRQTTKFYCSFNAKVAFSERTKKKENGKESAPESPKEETHQTQRNESVS